MIDDLHFEGWEADKLAHHLRAEHEIPLGVENGGDVQSYGVAHRAVHRNTSYTEAEAQAHVLADLDSPVTTKTVHVRDESAPIKHLVGVGNVYRCVCGRDVMAGQPCDGTQFGVTVTMPEKVDWAPLLVRLERHLKQNGSIVIAHLDPTPERGGEFVIGSEWGQEEEGSPMAGGAAYGTHGELAIALATMLSDAGV